MKTLTAFQALKNLLQDMQDCGCIDFYNEQDAIGVSGAVSDARQVIAAGDFDARNASGDNAITPEFLNAIRVYRSPDDVEMSLADQFRVIAERMEEDKPEDATVEWWMEKRVSDWKYEVANGDTKLGLREWAQHKIEMEKD